MYTQNKTKKLMILYTLENTGRLQHRKEMDQTIKIGQAMATVTEK